MWFCICMYMYVYIYIYIYNIILIPKSRSNNHQRWSKSTDALQLLAGFRHALLHGLEMVVFPRVDFNGKWDFNRHRQKWKKLSQKFKMVASPWKNVGGDRMNMGDTRVSPHSGQNYTSTHNILHLDLRRQGLSSQTRYAHGIAVFHSRSFKPYPSWLGCFSIPWMKPQLDMLIMFLSRGPEFRGTNSTNPPFPSQALIFKTMAGTPNFFMAIHHGYHGTSSSFCAAASWIGWRWWIKVQVFCRSSWGCDCEAWGAARAARGVGNGWEWMGMDGNGMIVVRSNP